MENSLCKQSEFIRKLWQDENLKQEFIANPNKIFEQELGLKIPEGVEVEVLEEVKGKHYFVIPLNPKHYGEGAQGVLESEKFPLIIIIPIVTVVAAGD